MAEMDKKQEQQEAVVVSIKVKPETKDKWDRAVAALKESEAMNNGEVMDRALNCLMANTWGTSHPMTAALVERADSMARRLMGDFVAIADQVESAQADAEARVKKQLDALGETISAQKRELDGEEGKPGLRKRAADRDEVAAKLEATRAELAVAQKAAAASSAEAEEAKARLFELQNKVIGFQEREAEARAQVAAIAEQANKNKVEMLIAQADAGRARLLEAELADVRKARDDAHRGLVQLQNEHRKTEEQLAAARAEVEELKKQIRRSVQRIGEPER